MCCYGIYLDGEAGLCALTALFTVDAVAEGADDGGVRGKGQVVVGPLSEDGHQVSVEGIALHPGVVSSENTVRHFPYLQHSQWTIWLDVCDLNPRASSFSYAQIIQRIFLKFLPGEGFDCWWADYGPSL